MRLGTLAGCFTRIDEIVFFDYWCIWILCLMWTLFLGGHQQWDNEHCWKAFFYTFKTNLRYIETWIIENDDKKSTALTSPHRWTWWSPSCCAVERSREPSVAALHRAPVEMRRVVPRRDASMAMVDELQMVPLDGQKWEGMAFQEGLYRNYVSNVLNHTLLY